MQHACQRCRCWLGRERGRKALATPSARPEPVRAQRISEAIRVRVRVSVPRAWAIRSWFPASTAMDPSAASACSATSRSSACAHRAAATA